jgi:hypothetical protein
MPFEGGYHQLTNITFLKMECCYLTSAQSWFYDIFCRILIDKKLSEVLPIHKKTADSDIPNQPF